MEKILENIEAIRKEKGIKQAVLGEILGVKQPCWAYGCCRWNSRRCWRCTSGQTNGSNGSGRHDDDGMNDTCAPFYPCVPVRISCLKADLFRDPWRIGFILSSFSTSSRLLQCFQGIAPSAVLPCPKTDTSPLCSRRRSASASLTAYP